jgi:hypothetical protein
MATSGDHRVAWLHIPKCGTSFGTTLVHYANASLPASFELPAPASELNSIYKVDVWFPHVFWLKGDASQGNIGNHMSITSTVWDRCAL